MTKHDAANAIAELMSQYDANRRRWIEANGTDQGFDQWFTRQVLGR